MARSLWAVKCELINYSYQYVQKKCVKLDNHYLKHFIFQNTVYDLNSIEKCIWFCHFRHNHNRQDELIVCYLVFAFILSFSIETLTDLFKSRTVVFNGELKAKAIENLLSYFHIS